MSAVAAAVGAHAPHRRYRTATRLVWLVPAAVALLGGLDAALMLLDLPAPVELERLPDVHGMVMVLGFVGTLVAVERAVALRRPAGFAAPGLLGLGALALLSPAPLPVGQTLQVLGAAGLVAVYVPLWRRQRDDAVLVQALGGVLAAGAALLWLGGTVIPQLVPWLVGFIVLTIAGERLELARVAMGSAAGRQLTLFAGGLVAGVTAALLWPRPGTVAFGAALLAITGWLAVHDVARRTVRAGGLTRFMAGCLLLGYFWLVVAGSLWLLGGPVLEGERYDAVLHAVFLGFAMSMIMAHAPVILPAVMRRPLPYHPVLIAPVALLHGSLAARLWLGDALGLQAAWVLGGVLNIVAVLAFFVLAAGSTVRGARRSS